MRHSVLKSWREALVSIHASVKDATKGEAADLSIGGFNPRICKRCDVHTAPVLQPAGVSIHASVKDATAPAGRRCNLPHVSIHASVKDATPH